MKKSLIALAVLAASSAAMAQSSVTLYGWIDTYLAHTTVDNGTTSTSTTSMENAAVNGNRWGLKGSEDLGGGLKANFQLEQGFTIDNGAAASALQFHRQAWVGLSGGFGAVKVGRVYSAYDDVNGAADPVFDSALSPAKYTFQSDNYTARLDNGVRYETPAMSGFTAAISTNLSEGNAATVTSRAFNVAYAGGPLTASLAYQADGSDTTAADAKYTRLNAAYNLGAATVKGQYGKADDIGNISGKAATEYVLGLDYSVSSALTVSGAYASSDDNAAAGDAKRTAFGLGAKYSLSKRTFVYGGYTSGKTEQPATADTKKSIFAIGINHAF